MTLEYSSHCMTQSFRIWISWELMTVGLKWEKWLLNWGFTSKVLPSFSLTSTFSILISTVRSEIQGMMKVNKVRRLPTYYKRGWQTIAWEPNPAHALFLYSWRAKKGFYIFRVLQKTKDKTKSKQENKKNMRYTACKA